MFLSPLGPPEQLALKNYRLFETADVDYAREQISVVMQPHQLRPAGMLRHTRAHMDFMRLRNLGIGTIKFGQAQIEVPPLADYHLLIFCLSGNAKMQAGTRQIELDARRGIFCHANEPLRGQFSSDCEQFILRIDRHRLTEFCGREAVTAARPLNLQTSRTRPLLALLRSLATDQELLRTLQEDAAMTADYEQLLLRMLLNAQREDEEDTQVPSRIRPASVRRAIDFIEAQADMPIILADIAAAAGVAERTLHDVFQRFEGVSPLRYLRNLRMERVRARLLAEGTGCNVTKIALEAGFTHLGRFAQDYAARFGELPSATKARNGLR